MRVLYVIDSLAPGGAETSLAEMAPGLARSGIDLHVIPLGARRDLTLRLEDAGAVVHRRQRPPGRQSNVLEILDVVRKIHPDAIHTTLFESDIAGRCAARRANLPVSSSLVNDSYNNYHRREASRIKVATAQALDRWTARYVSKFHSISNATAESVGPRLGISPEAITVIPRGRDPRRYAYRPAEVRSRTRAELGIGQDVPVVIAVGRLEPQKGHRHLLEALPDVVRDAPEVVTLIAGRDGRASSDLRTRAAELRTGDLRFLGERSDVPELLAAADVMCFPSEREGFGGVLIEALAVGCPVVSSNIPTSREVLTSDTKMVGLMTPVGDVRAIGAALKSALSSTVIDVAAGRAKFESVYAVDVISTQMASFFKAVR